MAFEGYGLTEKPIIWWQSPKRVLSSYLDIFSTSNAKRSTVKVFPNAKRSTVKVFLHVTLVSLTLRYGTF